MRRKHRLCETCVTSLRDYRDYGSGNKSSCYNNMMRDDQVPNFLGRDQRERRVCGAGCKMSVRVGAKFEDCGANP